MSLKVIEQIVREDKYQGEIGIAQWRTALKEAQRIESPRRSALYGVYDEVMLDTHLTAEIEKKILEVLNMDFRFVNSNGESDEGLKNLFKHPWFYDFIRLAMEAKYYGHSLIELGEVVNGELQGVDLIPRAHVVAQEGIVLKALSDDSGIAYRDDAAINSYLVEVGDTYDVGLLNRCVPHAFYKRFAMGTFSEYAESFITPLRIGKTNTTDTDSINRMEEMLANMSVAAYAVIGETENIEMVETNNQKNYRTFTKIIDLCNAEMTKCVHGAAVPEDGMLELAKKANLDFVRNVINFSLLPKLANLGYVFGDFYFDFVEEEKPSELLELAKVLLPYKNITNDWIAEHLGVTVEDKTEDLEVLFSAFLQTKKDEGFFDV